MRCLCPEGAASTVDFYIIFLVLVLVFLFLRNMTSTIALATADGMSPFFRSQVQAVSGFARDRVTGVVHLMLCEVRLGTFFVNRSITERLLTAYDFYHFCCRDNPSVIGDAAPDTSDAWL